MLLLLIILIICFVYFSIIRPVQCDASIQTEDPSAAVAGQEQSGANLNQHGLRNTTDLGQRAPLEDIRNDRAHSAQPPQNHLGNANQANAFASSNATPLGTQNITQTSTNGPNAYASANTNAQAPFYPGQQSFNYPSGYQFHGHPEAFVHQMPAFGQQFYPQQQQPGQFQNKQQQPQPHPQSQPQPQSQSQPQGNPSDNFVRNVPIFVEGRNVPIVAKAPPQQQQAAAPVPQQGTAPPTQGRQHPPPRPEPFASKEVFQQQQQSPPITSDQGTDPADEQNVLNTPHSADCIAKIQAIQRDVLELMCAVEAFGGKRGDKDYIYLDEMLTRNLLKLDTIDTNGKENIRLARKEAIKCIQASIAVLEAKADLDLNAKKVEANITTENIADNMDVDPAAASAENKDAPGDTAANEAAKDAIAIADGAESCETTTTTSEGEKPSEKQPQSAESAEKAVDAEKQENKA